MPNTAARLIPPITALLIGGLVSACAEYSSTDWPSIHEGFEYAPTKPAAEPAAPAAPERPAVMDPAKAAALIAETRERFETLDQEIGRLMAAYDADFEKLEQFKRQNEDYERAWLSGQFALSRVSQATDGLGQMVRDLEKAVAEGGGKDMEALAGAIRDYGAELDLELVAARALLEERRPG